jgi:acyl-CoA dehydrogenase
MELLIFIVIVLALGFVNLPLLGWFIFIGLYSFFVFDMGFLFLIPLIALGVLLINKEFRIKYLTQTIVDLVKKKGLLPKISPTEEAALQAGTSWVESNFFKAQVDFAQIKNEKVTQLTPEEQAFLDNEVEELCAMSKSVGIHQK